MKRGVRRLLFGLAAMGVAAPAWAEHAATRRIDAAVGTCEGGCGEHSIDIDFGGLSIRGAAVHGSRLRGHAKLVRVEPRLDGLHVRVEGLSARLTRSQPRPGPSTDADPTPSTSASDVPPPGFVNPLPGVPIHVSVDGSVSVAGPHETELVALDPSLEIEASGEVTTRLSGKLVRGDAVLAHARRVQLGAPNLSANSWTVSGEIELQSAAPILVAGHVGRDHANLRASAGGGTVDAELDWSTTGRLHVEGRRLGLGFLPRVSGLSEEAGIDLTQAHFDGSVDFERTEDGVDAHLDQVHIDGVVIEAAALSKDPLYLREIGIDGRVAFAPAAIAGALNVTHGDASAILSGRVDAQGVDVGAAIEPLPCQTLLESMPSGFVPALEGMQLAGEIHAEASVRFQFDALAQARANADDDAEQPAPGDLALDFPFLERCEVVRDPPGIDLEALAGNYRHRFLTAGGTEQTRILATGADGFVSIAAAPDLARAFVILEDARFWHHDGFDREQIERAFWHNLGVSGFSRGASTITQQTARNLWLGHERTLGRKLQEALLTARLEQSLDKRRILEIYMNIIELGPEIHGVAEAARYHFGRAPHELNTIEALHIASLAPAPVTYSRRFDSGEVDAQWREHLEAQVERLRVHHFMSRIGAEQAKQLPLRLRARDL